MSCSVGLTLDNLFSNCGANTLTLRTGLLILLAAQVYWTNDYYPAADYASKTDPTNLFLRPSYQLYPNDWTKFWMTAPDNACTRTINKSPLNFDFIVVGAGTAGATLARQLVNNTKGWKILLIEAGADPRVESIVPRFFPFNINNTNTYNYTGQIVNGSSNAFKNGIPLMCGKQLGGTSATNAMLYVVGNDRDYNGWAALGNIGWDYNSILPFIKKSEGNTDPSIVGDGTYHGTAGNLTVTTYPNEDSILKNLQSAFVEIGYPILNDYNARKYIGYVKLQGTVRGGERCHSYRAFIVPVKNNTNLYIMKNSPAVKINFVGTTATSVTVLNTNLACPNITLTATKEIILSAGAFGSPQVLQRSGIGRAADLPSGVKPVKDLNVGKNLVDHVCSIHFYKINPDAASETVLDISVQATQYMLNRTGLFAETGTSNANAFIDSLNLNGLYPDIQYTFIRFTKNQFYFAELLTAFGYKDEYITALVDINASYEILLVFTIVIQPYSRGSVKVNGMNPASNPTITSGYYTDSRDVDTQIRGINRLSNLLNTTAMSSLKPSLVKFNIPECDPLPYPSNDYSKCYIKYFSASLWHIVGTCKMGPSTDPNAVVDPTLKVYGITGLRVVDNSIAPYITAGNTQATAYMIGQKGADLIKASWP